MTRIAVLLLLVAAVGSFASVAVRTRRSQGEERRQLKTFLLAVAFALTVFLIPDEQLGLSGEVPQITLAVVGILALPIAVAIALLQPEKTPVRLQHSRPKSMNLDDIAARAGNQPPTA